MKHPEKATSTDIRGEKYIMPLYSANQFITRCLHLHIVFYCIHFAKKKINEVYCHKYQQIQDIIHILGT